MRAVLAELDARWAADERVGVATVVGTSGSSPRGVGASMLVPASGGVVGSVSGGCVDGDVHEVAQEVLVTGAPVLRRYGVSDDDAGAVGLTCGGTIEVFVAAVDREAFPGLPRLRAAVAAGRPVALVTLLEHPDAAAVGRRLVVEVDGDGVVTEGTVGDAGLDDAVAADVLGHLAVGRTTTLEYGPAGERRGRGARVLVESMVPPPRMIVVGVTDFAVALVRLGAYLGYRVSVCDARPVFATRERFPDADQVVVDWPHRYLAQEVRAGRTDGRTVVVVLTHDAKFDVPVLDVALRTPTLAFVGAMGSRRTHDDRMRRLRAAGLGDAELVRLSSPVGLDLGARTPEETAVSIAAEIVARRWGGGGAPLGTVAGPIHHG